MLMANGQVCELILARSHALRGSVVVTDWVCIPTQERGNESKFGMNSAFQSCPAQDGGVLCKSGSESKNMLYDNHWPVVK
jgi:hypothetical protein